jgi:hypothetical protein
LCLSFLVGSAEEMGIDVMEPGETERYEKALAEKEKGVKAEAVEA